MNEIYFSETYTNTEQKNINLEFSKKITKNEKTFLKLIFFKIISDFSLLENMKIKLEELSNNTEFSSITDYSLFIKNL
ncbi:MAG: replication initiation protein, partial [Pseudoleptotrichia goodfellowii]|nr:replication initiation protein [Pseudoleptotrichia goodfellowii]